MPPTKAPLEGESASHSRGLASPALAAVVLALALWGLSTDDDTPVAPHPAALPQPAQAASDAVAGTRWLAPSAQLPSTPSSAHVSSPQASVAPSQDLAAHVPPGQVPAMAEVIRRLNQAGVHTGLGAFNPPGTRPPLMGLAVPEDFELPAGYVRHHQATDDGQRIEAILMFAPDHPFVVAQPELRSRVVPPEMAPEGLPLRSIKLPAPRSTQP